MTSKNTALCALSCLGLAFSLGCNQGRASLKLKEVSRTIEVAGNKIDSKWEYDYDGDELEKVKFSQEGDDIWEKKISYKDGHVSKVVQDYDDDDRPKDTEEYEWEDGVVVKYESKTEDESKLAYEIEWDGNEADIDGEYEFDVGEDDDAKCGVEGKIELDDQNRMDKYSGEFKDDCEYSFENEWDWSDDGELEEFKEETDNNGNKDSEKTEYEYDDDTGAVTDIEEEDDDGEVSYDDDGRIEIIEWDDAGEYEFEYDDGDTSGLILLPTGLGGSFDLKGKPHSDFNDDVFGF